MQLTLPFWISSLLSSPLAEDVAAPQLSGVKQVAIIGAGAAGSSAAYHLHKYADEAGIDVNITLFEKTNHIGGRTLTVDVFDDPANPVELGASIFVEINHILFNATNEFNLTRKDPGSDEAGLLGVWDGERFVYTQNSESWGWWNLARLFWQYGTAPYYVQKLMKSTVGAFLQLYQAPYFPFRSLTSAAFGVGLASITGSDGLSFLESNKLYGSFAREIVQASTRVNYASNLRYIHGLGTMVAMAPEGAVQVEGGNWQIFSNMVNKSGAYVNLNSRVTDIALAEGSKSADYNPPQYTITTEDAADHSLRFDDVVIANPFQFSNITTQNGVIEHPVEDIPYVTLHVTLFSTPFLLSPAFFNLPPATPVPISVLTTLGEDEDPGWEEGAAAGRAGFFSVSLVKTVVNPKTQNKEYVFKIFSPEEVTPEFLSSLLGVQVPKTFTSNDEAVDDPDMDDTVVIDPISWIHPAVFHPYPQKLPRVIFQDPILADGLYYTSGIEGFISTMETSALMGMNVARLIVDDYLSEKDDELPLDIIENEKFSPEEL